MKSCQVERGQTDEATDSDRETKRYKIGRVRQSFNGAQFLCDSVQMAFGGYERQHITWLQHNLWAKWQFLSRSYYFAHINASGRHLTSKGVKNLRKRFV